MRQTGKSMGLFKSRCLIVFGVFGVFGALTCAGLEAQFSHNNEFVKHSGTSLTLGGEPFRYSGPNVEWLGLEGYGPLDSAGPRYASHLEIDDVLDTAKMMGARVVRSQTLGDSIGCERCIEPKLGEFNPDAFKEIDYVLKAAHDRELRLIVTLVGDCAYCERAGMGEYSADLPHDNTALSITDPTFFNDPKAIARFESHIAALLNHKNSLTGIYYKDDPTILAWEDCNGCGGGGSLKWIDTIGNFIKSIDKNHLYEDNGSFFFDKSGSVLASTTVDIFSSEYYPHWDPLMGILAGDSKTKTTAETLSKHAASTTSHGKVYVANEYGWDDTDWATKADLQNFLTAVKSDPNISGDLYWALQGHNNEYGWQAIPVNVPNKKFSIFSESGQWWALYYGGIDTLVMTKQDMADRAELLRTHAFEMAGVPTPLHTIPPSPVITMKGLGVIAWRGSAGAVTYSVERKAGNATQWTVICDKCATDSDTPWVTAEDQGSALSTVAMHYRVIAYNADGKASVPSAAR